MPVMVCFARSGGTLLNKCLGSLPGTVVLSEVNPMGGGHGREGELSHTTVRAQAKHWYGIDLSSDDFVEGIEELHAICERSGRRLIVRDFSQINFLPKPDRVPPRRLLTVEKLQERLDIIPFAFVRNCIDIILSMSISMENFFPHYLFYLQEVSRHGMRVFKFEDFCSDPEAEMRKICDHIDVPYDEAFTRDYASFDRANGDTQIRGGSRGARQGGIRPLPRKRVPFRRIREISGSRGIKEANDLLGYSSGYFSEPVEKRIPLLLGGIAATLQNMLASRGRGEKGD